MKNFFPLKSIVIILNVLFIFPLFFILKFQNTTTWVVIKIILILWMISLIIIVFKKYYYITLGPLLCYEGLFFMLTWFFLGSWISYIFSLLFVIQLGFKFWEIDQIHDIYNERHKDDKRNKVNRIEIIDIAIELQIKKIKNL